MTDIFIFISSYFSLKLCISCLRANSHLFGAFYFFDAVFTIIFPFFAKQILSSRYKLIHMIYHLKHVSFYCLRNTKKDIYEMNQINLKMK